jgi:hypothetical protein
MSHTLLSSSEIMTQSRLVLAISSAVEKPSVLGLGLLSTIPKSAVVELVQLFLGALRQCCGGGVDGAEIHWIKAEHGRARGVNDNIGWCCNADGGHVGSREEMVYTMMVW